MRWPLHDQLAIAHALFACIAVLFTMPIALLAARYLRHGPRWFRIHVIFNGITTFLVILVFGLGMGAVSTQNLGTQFNGPYSDLHHKLGLTIFILVLAQTILGIFSHYYPGGHISRRVHVAFGTIVAAGMIWETWEGLHNEWAEMSVSMTVTPQGVQIVFWAVFMVLAIAYGAAVGQVALRKVAVQTYEDVKSDEKLPISVP
ncbi:hypothetical protein SCP_0507870 [Sparassis crispa]|uniref:Cytochrome b561 domain-containing protein n=1 Tax=Sparassis crispa TaxID=139825 RepID=A0A401GNB3_9APHY|nr:hypothetical protein SCP_0507870 [Sparassis crispa]GBE83731.1 hypothetical protein SCP_0507870 [Sparassis crispa]